MVGHTDCVRSGAGTTLPLLSQQTQVTDSKQLFTQSSGHLVGDDRENSDGHLGACEGFLEEEPFQGEGLCAEAWS